MGAISAALLDLQPATARGSVRSMGVVAPLPGLAAGALVAGLLVQYGPDPTRLVFWLLVGAFALAAARRRRDPGDGRARRPLARRRCGPRIAVPASLRAAFVAAHPVPGRDLGAGRADPLARRPR